MNKTIFMFRTVTLRPHWFQYIINEIGCILLLAICLWITGFCRFPYHELGKYGCAVLLCYLLFRLIYLARMEYIISGEQIIILHGVFSHSTDYVELYRVVDYQQHRSLLQQLFGLKTVTIFSGDRNNPKLDMIGIKATTDIVAEIRCRVEFNKKNKGIYEITNHL